MQTVYIETTIPSWYHTVRTTPEAVAKRDRTRRWWSTHRHRFACVTSEAVIRALAAAPPMRAAPRLQLIERLPLIPVTPDVLATVRAYITHKACPATPLVTRSTWRSLRTTRPTLS